MWGNTNVRTWADLYFLNRISCWFEYTPFPIKAYSYMQIVVFYASNSPNCYLHKVLSRTAHENLQTGESANIISMFYVYFEAHALFTVCIS